MFEGTKIPLRKWFYAIYMLTCHKKGISSLQLSKDLHRTQKTSWFMTHRIREIFKQDYKEKFDGEDDFNGFVEELINSSRLEGKESGIAKQMLDKEDMIVCLKNRDTFLTRQ